MKYYNGCSLVDFFSFSLQTEVTETYGEGKIRRTSEPREPKDVFWMVDLCTLQTRKVLILKALSVKLKLLPLKDRR